MLGQEDIPFEAGALALLARAAQGSMRDALSLLDQSIAYGGGSVDEDQVRAMLGAIDQGYLFDLLEKLADSDAPGLIGLAGQMETRSLSFDAALQDLGALLDQIALAQTVPEAIVEDLPGRARLLDLAQRFSAEDVQLHYQIVLHGRRDLSLAPDEYAGFSMTLLRMLAFSPVTGMDAAPKARPEALPRRQEPAPVAVTVASEPNPVIPDPLPPEAPVNRVTLTGAAIGAARTAILVINGAKKREVLETAIEQGGKSAYPVGRVLDKIIVPVDIYCLDD